MHICIRVYKRVCESVPRYTFGGFYINKMLLYVYVNTIVVISTFFHTMVRQGLCFTFEKLQCVACECATVLPSLLSFTYIHTNADPYTDQHHPPSFLTKINAPIPFCCHKRSVCRRILRDLPRKCHPTLAAHPSAATNSSSNARSQKTGQLHTHLHPAYTFWSYMLSTFKNSPVSPTQPLSILFCQMPP